MKTSSKLLFLVLLTISAASLAAAQAISKPGKTVADPDDLRAIKSSPAYAEVLLRETELKAELESQLLDHTEEFPKVKEVRGELELLRSEMDRLLAVKATDTQKLSSALGRLILVKVGHQTKLRQLRLQYSDDHPTVRRQRKTVETYEAAIREILG
jgi:hypothetical protein